MVTKSSAGTADEATKASWRVDDLAAEVADPVRAASRFLTYPISTPSMASPMSASRSRLAVDPHGNSIGLLQFKVT